jgi:hypothetical protein
MQKVIYEFKTNVFQQVARVVQVPEGFRVAIDYPHTFAYSTAKTIKGAIKNYYKERGAL